MSRKTKRSLPIWQVLMIGTGMALAIDMAAQLLLAGLTVSGTLPESAVFPLQAAAAGCAALVGGYYSAGRTAWGTLAGAMLVTTLFISCLLLFGLLIYDSLTLMGRGGLLLIIIVVSGLTSGILNNSIHHRKKKRRL